MSGGASHRPVWFNPSGTKGGSFIKNKVHSVGLCVPEAGQGVQQGLFHTRAAQLGRAGEGSHQPGIPAGVLVASCQEIQLGLLGAQMLPAGRTRERSLGRRRGRKEMGGGEVFRGGGSHGRQPGEKRGAQRVQGSRAELAPS